MGISTGSYNDCGYWLWLTDQICSFPSHFDCFSVPRSLPVLEGRSGPQAQRVLRHRIPILPTKDKPNRIITSNIHHPQINLNDLHPCPLRLKLQPPKRITLTHDIPSNPQRVQIIPLSLLIDPNLLPILPIEEISLHDILQRLVLEPNHQFYVSHHIVNRMILADLDPVEAFAYLCVDDEEDLEVVDQALLAGLLPCV